MEKNQDPKLYENPYYDKKAEHDEDEDGYIAVGSKKKYTDTKLDPFYGTKAEYDNDKDGYIAEGSKQKYTVTKPDKPTSSTGSNGDKEESTRSSGNKLEKEERKNTNFRRFPLLCAVFCIIALLFLVSIAALVLSIWNTFQLHSSTTEGTSEPLQQSQFTRIMDAVQNLSNAVDADLNQLNKKVDILERNLLNVSLSGLEMSLNTLNENSIDAEAAAEQVNNTLNTFQATVHQLFQLVYSVPECGSGLWQRLVYFNMGDSSERCPPAWSEYRSPERSCGVQTTVNTLRCDSSVFSTHGTNYSRVCGRIIGYQRGIPDAFHNSNNIEEAYVDGISVTHGNPRTHIWTFAAGFSDRSIDQFACPCTNPSAQASPPFVGNNYFCESGSAFEPQVGTFYSGDPLWDGAGCVHSQCECTFNSPPWFNVQLPSSTTDDIEVRICANENSIDEDTPIQLIEIYLQ